MGMEAGLDTGPVYAKKSIEITNQNTLELHNQLSEISAKLLNTELINYLNGHLKAEAQDNQKATHAKKLTKSEEALNWKMTALDLYQKIRAFSPAPGLYTDIKNKKIKIIDAQVESSKNQGEYDPGEVIMVDKHSLIIATGSGSINIKLVKPAGKQVMSINSFLSGFKINSGDCFE